MSMPIRVGDIVRLKTGHSPQMVVDVRGDNIYCRYLKSDVTEIIYKNRYFGFDLNDLVTSMYKTRYRRKADYILANEGDGFNLFGSTSSQNDFNNHQCSLCNKYEVGFHHFEEYHNIVDYLTVNGKWKVAITYLGERVNTMNDEDVDDCDYNDYLCKQKTTPKTKTKGTTMTKIGTLFKSVEGDDYGTYLATNSQGEFVLEMRNGKGEVRAFAKDKIEEVVPFTFAIRWNGANQNQHYLGDKDSVKVDDLFLCKSTLKFGRVVDVNTKCRDCNTTLKAYRAEGFTLFESIKNESA